MAREKKKYKSGAATNYVSRAKAMKKLQLSHKDFRRLCILKGVYPHEPRHKKKVNKGSTENKTYYYVKDINFLANEPLINKFREYKIFLRRLAKAKGKGEKEQTKRLLDNKPTYTLDRMVKERYPSFVAAIRDLDDALCLCFLFATLPHTRNVKPKLVQDCRKLTTEFLHYVIAAKALRKVFVSIKGIYYQTEVMGEKVTFIVPHERGNAEVSGVDFSVMATFIEFYTTMLGFVNFRLYKAIGLNYPPVLNSSSATADLDRKFDPSHFVDAEDTKERVYSLAQPLKYIADAGTVHEDEANEPDEFPPEEGATDGENERMRKEWETMKRLRHLFDNCRFFLGREVPKEALTLIIRSCGGMVSWEHGPGSTFSENDQKITHQVVDRPQLTNAVLSRTYVQPQWVFDCFNARRRLGPEKYFPGATLPPHLSPFVEEKPGDYVPPERLEQLKFLGEDVDALATSGTVRAQEKVNSAKKKQAVDKEQTKDSKKADSIQKPAMVVKSGVLTRGNKQKQLNEEGQQLKMREMMIAKKHRRVYHKIKHGQKRKSRELQEKRKMIEQGTVDS